MVVRKGDSGAVVEAIQTKLGIEADGAFGPNTEAAVEQFQREKGLEPDGVVGPNTASVLGLDLEELLTTDTADRSFVTAEGLLIQKSYLDEGQYCCGPTDKFYVFLHHTAGGHDPFATVRNWNNDSRGRIATQFVVGNKSTRGDTSRDGVVVECFPQAAWAYHLGESKSRLLHPHSIGIEICNYGWLEKKDGRFHTYVDSEVPEDQVCDLGFVFRGHRYYHKYSDTQIASVRGLLKEIALRHSKVDLAEGIPRWLRDQDPGKIFDYSEPACKGEVRGLLTHTNTRSDKSDCSPQPALVEMLRSL
ncbi:peptidoglycan-binding protein [Candidatus Eisenbacteria bacterium]|uniref:Peptidoglycan-binding protein n=1 Tax=Eiseniibacteriota bacterium TaxID=2212470 RepID=A0ABV6YKG0_UNCEI